MQLAVEEASSGDAVTPSAVVAIHRALMANAPNVVVAGQLREHQNWIGGNDYNPCGAAFVPPPPEHVRPLLDDLCSAIADPTLPPLVQAAIVHAQFETIHPFLDGNGRTGRALVQVTLRRRGLAPAYVPPISVVLAARKTRYIDGLTKYRRDEVGAWIEQFSAAAAKAAGLANRYLDRVTELQE
jgi:Fic family protein